MRLGLLSCVSIFSIILYSGIAQAGFTEDIVNARRDIMGDKAETVKEGVGRSVIVNSASAALKAANRKAVRRHDINHATRHRLGSAGKVDEVDPRFKPVGTD